MPDFRPSGYVDYLAMGGRISKAQALLGSMLNIKPMLTIKDGLLVPAGRVRSRAKGIDILFEFVKNNGALEDLAVIYNTEREEAQAFVKRLGALFPEENKASPAWPALGVHTGPGIIFIALRGKTG